MGTGSSLTYEKKQSGQQNGRIFNLHQRVNFSRDYISNLFQRKTGKMRILILLFSIAFAEYMNPLEFSPQKTVSKGPRPPKSAGGLFGKWIYSRSILSTQSYRYRAMAECTDASKSRNAKEIVNWADR